MFLLSLYSCSVRKGQEHTDDLLCLQWCNLYCHVLYLPSKKFFTFSFPFSKCFCLFYPSVSFWRWRDKTQEIIFLLFQVYFCLCKTLFLILKLIIFSIKYCNCYYDDNSEAENCFLNIYLMEDVQVSESIMYFKCLRYHNYQ